MAGYVTPNYLSRVLSLPVSLTQTELRRGRDIQIMQFDLNLGQVLELRALNLHLIKVLTPGVTPIYVNRSLGLASLGVYEGPMLTGALALVKGANVGVTQFNPWMIRRFVSPGTYTVIVSNNTRNVDLSVAAMGALKLYL
jgi:hypothetical protein